MIYKFFSIFKSITLIFIVSFITVCNYAQTTTEHENLFKNISGNERIDSLNKYASNLTRSKPELRKSIGKESFELAKKANYNLGQIQSLFNIGAGFFHALERDSALFYYKKSSCSIPCNIQ
ncbi:MAG: hypothetical protein KKD75_02825 [Nanoarchaeota archaeon]|nr:hypothetical protein [Nanoarchaeota archaeon]